MIREIEKLVMIEEREFIIKKMTAMEGIAVLKELLTKALPVDLLGLIDGSGVQSSQLKGVASFVGGATSSKEMSMDDFVEFQKRILRNTQVKMPGGNVYLMDKFGNFKVDGIEYDMNIVTQILTQILMFNYQDFFIELLQKLNFLIPLEEEEGKAPVED